MASRSKRSLSGPLKPPPNLDLAKAQSNSAPSAPRHPDRTNLSSGTPWEEVVGYSRVVRVGKLVEVTGTVATDESGKAIGNTPYQQTVAALKKIQRYLELAGACLEDVVRTRIYVLDISKWEEVGRAHGEVFKDIKPATSMIQISALIDPTFLVEIEATAMLPEGENPEPVKAVKSVKTKPEANSQNKPKARGRSASPKRASAKKKEEPTPKPTTGRQTRAGKK